MGITKINLNGTTYSIGASIEEGVETSYCTVEFTSGDELDPSSANNSIDLIISGDTHQSLFEKLSNGMKNIRWLLKQMGSSDIVSIGDGTVTGALLTLQSSIPQWEEI